MNTLNSYRNLLLIALTSASLLGGAALAAGNPGAAFCADGSGLSDGAEIAVSRGCLGCHTVSSKRVGPSYKEVAKKYGNDGETVRRLAAKIKNGGSGNWGSLSMPANAVSEEEALVLAKWVLSL